MEEIVRKARISTLEMAKSYVDNAWSLSHAKKLLHYMLEIAQEDLK